MSEITKDDVVRFIEGMTVLELSALVKELEEKFGVSAAAPMMAAVAVGGAAPAAAAEEQTEFNAILTGFGAEKIQVIKVVRAITNLGLKEAKDLVDGAPKEVMTQVNKKTAEEAKAKLAAAGATVELK